MELVLLIIALYVPKDPSLVRPEEKELPVVSFGMRYDFLFRLTIRVFPGSAFRCAVVTNPEEVALFLGVDAGFAPKESAGFPRVKL